MPPFETFWQMLVKQTPQLAQPELGMRLSVDEFKKRLGVAFAAGVAFSAGSLVAARDESLAKVLAKQVPIDKDTMSIFRDIFSPWDFATTSTRPPKRPDIVPPPKPKPKKPPIQY